MGQLRDDGVPVDVDDRLVARLLLDDLEGAPREVLRRDPPDVAVPLAELAEEDEGVPDLLHRPLVLRADREAEYVEVGDVAYLVLGEGDPAAKSELSAACICAVDDIVTELSGLEKGGYTLIYNYQSSSENLTQEVEFEFSALLNMKVAFERTIMYPKYN